MEAPINIDILSSYNIPNFKVITSNSITIGARGQTLSAPKRRWILEKMNSAGISTIIDLRAGDSSNSFHNACNEAGLSFLHFPVDKFRTPSAVIIENLPSFIKAIDTGGFYMSCALGLHRTDIALSLYYIFNPLAQEPPVLYGHFRDGKLWYDDIFQRIGSIYHSLTEADKKHLGWDDTLDKEIVSRKRNLIEHQEKYL